MLCCVVLLLCMLLGEVSTLAGDLSSTRLSEVDGVGTNAILIDPTYLRFSPLGGLYILDIGPNLIRVISAGKTFVWFY